MGDRLISTIRTVVPAAWALFLGWLGYRAGKNAYEIFPSVEHAAIHGATALRRWWGRLR